MKTNRAGILALHVITWALLVVVAAPVLVVLAGAFVNPSLLGVSSERWAAEAGQSVFAQSWFGYVFALYGSSMRFSLLLALLSVAVCIVVSVPAAYAAGPITR